MKLISTDDCAWARMRIAGTLRQAGVPIADKHKAVWACVLAQEMMNGTRFLITIPDGNLYAVVGISQRIMALPRPGRGGDTFFAYLHQYYGLSEREDLTRFVYDCLRGHGLSHGTHVELRRFAAYVECTQTVYMSGYNGQMWRLDGVTVPELVDNGEEETFFIDDDGGQPVPDIVIGPHGVLLDRLTSLNFTEGLGGITAEQQRQALTIWLFALAFPDLMPTKPLVILEGTQGSGKSAAMQLIQLALMGAVKPMIISRNKEDAFGILLLRSPIAVIDNMDTYIEWVADAICAYTTNGIFPRRKLYSDDEEVVIKPHAFVAVASKNPASFRREDVADRCIIIRLERRSTFGRFARLKSEILAQRGQLFGEYLWFVNQIVAEIRAGALEDAPEDEVHRMADFAAIGRVVGRVCGWSENAVADLMNALQAERDCFAAEEDVTPGLLQEWIAYRVRTGGSNIGRAVSISELFAELETLAQARGIDKQFYKSPKLLAQKIRSPHILRDFDIDISIVHNQKIYKLWRKTDPHLGVVPGAVTLGVSP